MEGGDALRIAVTGAKGYIGSAVVRAATRLGIEVLALSRPGYDLLRPLEPSALGGVSAVIHLAYDGGASRTGGTDPNVEGTARLLDAARRRGARFVFVSSQSAGTGARSRYAQSKAAAEHLVGEAGDVVVRPGMVYGGPTAALYGRLCALVRRRRIVLVPRAGAPIQPIHVDDLALALLRLATAPSPARRLYQLGAPEPVTFGDFLSAIARHRFGRRIAIVPLPLWPLAFAARAVRRLAPPFAELDDRVTGLEALRPMETRSSLEMLGVTLREVAAALQRDADEPGSR